MSIDQTAIVLRRKISSFCEMKLAPLTDAKQFHAISEYMTGLIDDRVPPPSLGRHVNWKKSRAHAVLSKHRVSSGELRSTVSMPSHGGSLKPGESIQDPRPRAEQQRHAAAQKVSQSRKLQTLQNPVIDQSPAETQAHRRVPEPLFESYDEPVSFQAALQFHIDRFGESYYHLHRAIFRDGDALEATTLLSWLKGTKAPRSVANLEILNRIERRYRLPFGYFKKSFRISLVPGSDMMLVTMYLLQSVDVWHGICRMTSIHCRRKSGPKFLNG